MDNKRIIINSRDYAKLRQLIATNPSQENQYIKNLDHELSNATLLDPDKIPPDVITMNTRVCFSEADESEDFIYTIVYPEDADIEQGKISVLAPIGTALLGYRTGDKVSWKVPAGVKTFIVKKILYQPESEGNYYL